MMTRPANNRGFSLLEIGIVLTIVGLLVGAIWVAMADVFQNNKTNQLIKDAVQLIQNTRTLFAGQPKNVLPTYHFAGANNFPDLSNAIATGIFPSDMISSTACVVITPFSTDPTLGGFNIQSGSSFFPVLIYIFGAPRTVEPGGEGIPASACIQLLMALGSAQNIKSLGITGLGGGANPWIYAAQPITSMTVTQAADECNADGNGNSVYVYFDPFK